MKESIREEYLDYIDKIEGLSDEKYIELVDLFDNKLSEKDSIKLKIFIDSYKEQEVYNYRLLNETLKDIANDNIIAKNEEKEPEIIEFDDEEFEEDGIIEEIEEEDIEEEDIEEENEVEETKKPKKIGPFKRFYYNHIKKYDYVDGELEPIEIEEPKIIEFDAKEEPEEEYNDEFEEDGIIEEIEEEKEVEETKKPKKIGPFKRFYYNHIKKYDYVDGELEPIEIEEAEEKKGFFKKLKDKIKSIFKKDENKKINYINDFVNDNYLENDEIMSFMDLLEEREDKEKIVNKLYKYVKYSTDALDEDKFIDKLYDLFELAREDEYEEPIKKVEEPEIIEEKAIEEPEIIEEKVFEEIKTVEEPKEVKKSTRDITKLSDNYKERMKELRNEYTEYEIMFIEDAHSECLELGDQEFDQMLNERCIDKRRIYRYLLEVEKIKLLNVYDNLDEYEKMFIEDAHSECLELGDQEFDQMANERRINKEVIIKFYEILNKSKENQDKIIAKCKKEFLKLDDVNLEDKKVKELKEIAKDNNMKTTSKMKKAELINMLNELKKLKEEDLNKRLGLTK